MADRVDHFIRLLDELARTRGRTLAAFRDIRARQGLSEVENIVLNAVTGADRPPTVPQIGRSLGHPRQVIQRAADVLVARGLIGWCENPDHKRARLLVATPAGLAMQAEATVAGRALTDALTHGIDPDLIATVASGLHAIRTAFEANVRARDDEA